MNMPIRAGHFVLAVAFALAGARAAVAQEDSTIINAVMKFVDAMEAGDAEALEQSIAADTQAQEKTRKTFVEMAMAQKGVEKAAIRRFGQEEGKKFRCGFELIVNESDRRTLSNARVKWIDPNNAAEVERPGEVAPMPVKRNRKGVWQVELQMIQDESDEAEQYQPPVPWPQPGMQRQIALANIRNKRYRDITSAFRETQARIENGQLASAAAAQAELIGKLTAASAEAAKARAAIPSRFKDRPAQ